jgi:hypothetical protein
MVGLSVTALVPILLLLALLSTDVWVYADAKAQSEQGTPIVFSAGSFKVDTPASWFVACLILWILFFPLYITSRNQVR